MTTISISIPDNKLARIQQLLIKEGAKILTQSVAPPKRLTSAQKRVKTAFDAYEAEKGRALTVVEKEDLAFGTMMDENKGGKVLNEAETKQFFDKLKKKLAK